MTLLDTVGSRVAVALAPVADDAAAPPAREHDGAVGDGDGDGHLVAVGGGDGAQSVCGSIGSGHAVDIGCASARGSRKRGRPRGSTKCAHATLSHIWRPGNAKQHSERTFANMKKNHKKGNARKHYAYACLVPVDCQEGVSACVC